MAKNTTLKIDKGIPAPMGQTVIPNGYNMSVYVGYGSQLEIHLYDIRSGKREFRLAIPDEYRVGDVYCFSLSGISFKKYSYNYYDGKRFFTDPYATIVDGCYKWGVHCPKALFGDVITYDWEDSRKPCHSFKDVVAYTLNVRGFTKHASSKVKYKGCFEGIIEKIPHFIELGINQIILMPAYEYDEVIKKPVYKVSGIEYEEAGINYWGFTDSALYLAPKAAYSGQKDPVKSMKDLVKALHKANIEIIMQFYFPEDKSVTYIGDVLRFWMFNYQIDGFWLMGQSVPVMAIQSDPMLADVKLYLWSSDNVTAVQNGRRRIAFMQDDYMCDMRRFLKSDEDMLGTFVKHMMENNSSNGILNFITSYYGFTLMDLVSYDRKHNEANGEDNNDGSNHNFSWNCGAEGPCRKKNVLSLRKKQIFNAFTFMLMSAGTPMILAGDEFGNSQSGNNNAYCQDNEVTYLNWKDLDKNRDIFNFLKALISFRKNSTLLRSDMPKRMMDVSGSGYPDLSIHGEQAWYPRYESFNRNVGLMYTGKDEYIYAAYNMYWMDEYLALPKLPKNYEWHVIMDTSKGFYEKSVRLEEQDRILVKDRSCMLLVGEPA